MDTLIIKKLLKKFNCFKGIYPSDRLPFKEKLPLNIIVNTDPSNKPGQHWVAISINRNGVGEYFDSFGLPPMVENIIDFLFSKCYNGWDFNHFQLQNIFSTTCGHYCIMFIIYHCEGLSTNELVSQFNSSTHDNDKRMLKIFGKYSFGNKKVK